MERRQFECHQLRRRRHLLHHACRRRRKWRTCEPSPPPLPPPSSSLSTTTTLTSSLLTSLSLSLSSSHFHNSRSRKSSFYFYSLLTCLLFVTCVTSTSIPLPNYALQFTSPPSCLRCVDHLLIQSQQQANEMLNRPPMFQLVEPEYLSFDNDKNTSIIFACTIAADIHIHHQWNSCTQPIYSCCQHHRNFTINDLKINFKHLPTMTSTYPPPPSSPSSSSSSSSFMTYQQRETSTSSSSSINTSSLPSSILNLPLSHPTIDKDIFYQKYFFLDVLTKRWQNISRLHPNISLSSIGTSIEGRDIPLLRIGDPKANRKILINSAQHAREWVTVPVATYLAERFAHAFMQSKNSSNDIWVDIFSNTQILIAPMVNPDGYEYTRFARFWRKNRRKFKSPLIENTTTNNNSNETLDNNNNNNNENDNDCDGVDLNRNWPIDFAGKHHTSRNPCSDTYHGTSSLSEPESKALAELILSEKSSIQAHIDIHSFGQLLLGPYSHSNETPANGTRLQKFGFALRDAVYSVHKKEYRFSMGASNDLYPVSGDMSDFVFFHGIWSMTAELRPASRIFMGRQGFDLNNTEILPTAQEWFRGVAYMAYLVATNNDLVKEWTENENTQTLPMWAIIVIVVIASIIFIAMLIWIIITIVTKTKRRRMQREFLIQARAGTDRDGSGSVATTMQNSSV